MLLESKSEDVNAFCAQPAIKDCTQYCKTFCTSELGDLGDLSQFIGVFEGFGADCSDASSDSGAGYYGEGLGLPGTGLSPSSGAPTIPASKQKQGSIFPVLFFIGVMGFMYAPPPATSIPVAGCPLRARGGCKPRRLMPRDPRSRRPSPRTPRAAGCTCT